MVPGIDRRRGQAHSPEAGLCGQGAQPGPEEPALSAWAVRSGGSVEKATLTPPVIPLSRKALRTALAKGQVWVSLISATFRAKGSSLLPAPMAEMTGISRSRA